MLYEYLGEEYPEVLGSILGALKAIVNVIGMTKMTPPIKDLLPRLTPILKNRHEKVRAESCGGTVQIAYFTVGCCATFCLLLGSLSHGQAHSHGVKQLNAEHSASFSPSQQGPALYAWRLHVCIAAI